VSCDGRVFQQEIDRLFADDLPEARRAPLREHLSACASCRSYYDRVALLQQRLAPGQPLGSSLFDGADLVARFAGPLQSRWRRMWPWAAMALGTLGAILLVVRMGPTDSRRAGGPAASTAPSGGLQERGAAATRLQGVRAFCLTRSASGAPVVLDSASMQRSPAVASLRCDLHGALQFAYSADDPAYLFLVGVDAGGQPHYYAPRGDAEESIALRAGARELPLPDSVRLDVNHPPGATRVLALFTARPLGRRAVSDAIAARGVDGARALADDAQLLSLELIP
jgi:hypothetical protein